MEKELFTKDKYPIVVDDLKFDGKNIIIPSYWAGVISDYIKSCDINQFSEADRSDFKNFKMFLNEIEDYKNTKYL